jgi:tetratricopeptide (TPR) repeat protein
MVSSCRLRAALVAIVVSSAAITPHVAAEDALPPGYDAAVTRAFGAFEARDYNAARAGFLEAHAVYPNARTLRALGKTEYELGHYAEALAYLEDALRSDERPLTSEQRAETEALSDELRRLVARVTVKLSPHSAELSLDGSAAKLRPDGALFMAAGPHTLEANAPGYLALQQPFSVNGGDDLQLALALVPSAPSAPAAEATPAWHQRRWVWIGVGAALAAGVIAGSVIAAQHAGSSDGPAHASGTTMTTLHVPARFQ